MRRRILVGVSVLSCAVGCNEIAGIEPGTLDTSTTTTTSSGGTDPGTTTDTTSSTNTECVSNETRPCYEGANGTDGIGDCKAGVNKCVDGLWSATCYGQVLPSVEQCDGHDNNCDGKVDEGCNCNNGNTQNCFDVSGTPGVGVCKFGQQMCSGGFWGACVGAIGAELENCANPGADNDCDGIVDNVPNLNMPCSTGFPGICDAGTLHCAGDLPECAQDMMAVNETCANPGTDDNCDGVVDNVPGVGDSCMLTIAQLGVTCSGTFVCSGGSVACTPSVYHATDFASVQGWTLEGDWQIGLAQASSGQQAGNPDPPLDHSPSADNKIAGTVVGGNVINQPAPAQYLTSPIIDTQKGPGSVYITYYRYLNTNPSTSMHDTIEMSKDGGATWTPLWNNDPGTPILDLAWTPYVYDVTAYKSANFRVRFGVEVIAQGPLVSGWNIDDVTIASCPAP